MQWKSIVVPNKGTFASQGRASVELLSMHLSKSGICRNNEETGEVELLANAECDGPLKDKQRLILKIKDFQMKNKALWIKKLKVHTCRDFKLIKGRTDRYMNQLLDQNPRLTILQLKETMKRAEAYTIVAFDDSRIRHINDIHLRGWNFSTSIHYHFVPGLCSISWPTLKGQGCAIVYSALSKVTVDRNSPFTAAKQT